MATTNIQGLTLRQLPMSKVKHYSYYQCPRLNITAITNVQG